MTSRSVSLTSTFLLLAAGGAAACDRDRYHREGFYCADENGVVVDERYCDASYTGSHPYYIYHSPGYSSGWPIGYRLPTGGNRFAYNDSNARSSFGLPTSGRIGNGTVKTNVVGKGGSAHVSSGSHSSTSGHSSSGSHSSGHSSGG